MGIKCAVLISGFDWGDFYPFLNIRLTAGGMFKVLPLTSVAI